MTTPCSTATNHNFNIVIKASLELINLPLIDILTNHVKDVDLFKKIKSCQTLLSGRNQLRTDQRRICFLTPPAKPDYKQFDVTLLYKLIRNLCPLLRPTQGWGNEPQPTDTQLGDDIERLRLFRNNYYAHAVSKTIPDTEFETLWKDLKSVIRRIQANCQTVCSVNYEQELIAIENSKFSHGYLEKCKVLLEAFLKLQTDERDEPEVVIEGKDEVMCGDLAQFIAVLKPYSTCWSITWQKRRGKVIEIIDTSTEKYSGSTNRKLVIQSVCKEDEGEYRVLLSHKSNGNGYIRCGYTICLHVFGEVPYLNDLRVTTGDEGIIIHYEVSRQSPEVQSIEWKKDGQVLNTKACKYTGGSINSSSLTIRLPTEEDKGKYSCIITNAVGSVSKDVMLDVPSVAIEVNPTVYFGSNATITAVVSSTPPPEQVIWQKSKDGNNFHCIDIRKPKYYGSNDIHSKPLLVIPKATFDDKLNYRLLVRNKIRESISETVHLNVTGSPPNITTSQETNIKCKLLKLIGNVSLYDDSPDILEVFWTKNGEKIDTWGSGGRLSEVTIDNPSLIIRDVNVDDAGNYQLTAVNAVGSTTSNVITLDVPGVSFENTENKEDDIQRFVVTIQSVPSPLFVQWSSKGMNEDVYTPIDCNGEDYKGTINTIPHPVLVVKKSHLEHYNYQIEVTNFFGCTVKQISDNQHHLAENVTTENKVYKDRDAGIKFAKLSNYLAKHFPHQEFQSLKLILLASEKVKNVSALMSAKSALECFTILHEENLFTQKDVIFMQFLCKETGCEELYSQCIKYALTNKALCYFEKPPDNGYKNVQFHVQGNLDDYTKEQIEHIVEAVADILDCETQDIFVNGVKPSNSFFLVLSLKEVYTWKLSKMKEQDSHRLMNLNIDFFIVDLKTIHLQNVKGRSDIGSLKNEMPNFPNCGRLQTFTAFSLNSNLSTQNEGRDFETDGDNEDKIILDLNSTVEKRGITKRDEKCQFTIDIDQPDDKLFANNDVQHLNTEPCSGLPSISPPAESRVVPAVSENCCTLDEKNIMKKNKTKPYKDKTSAMVSDEIELPERELFHLEWLSNQISPPSEGQYQTSFAKGKRCFCSSHQSSPQNVSGNSFSKSLMYSNIDSCQVQKQKEQEQMTDDLSLPLHTNMSIYNATLKKHRLAKRICKECREYYSPLFRLKRRSIECKKYNLITDHCYAKNCVCSKRRDDSIQTENEGKLNSSAMLQKQQQSPIQANQGWNSKAPHEMVPVQSDSKEDLNPSAEIRSQQQSSSRQADRGWLGKELLEMDSHVLKLDEKKNARKKKHKEAFGQGKKRRPNRHRKSIAQNSQFSVDLDQPKAKSFTSSDVDHLDTWSLSKWPSLTPFESNSYNPFQSESKRELNPSAEIQSQQQSSSKQADQGWRGEAPLETCSHVFKLDERDKTKKKKNAEAFGLGKIVRPNRHRKSIAENGQFRVDVDQSEAKSFTSSDVDHLDTGSLSKWPSTSPLKGDRVELIYNRDEKNPIVNKPYIHENFRAARVSETMRLHREHLLICSNIDRCLILKTLKEQIIRHQLQSENLKNNDIVPKDSAKMQEERFPKAHCEESLKFPSEQSKIKRRPIECNTHDLITYPCPARNCVPSQRSDNPFQCNSKGELNLSAENQSQQQSSSKQADIGLWWKAPLEMDSCGFKLNKDKNVKRRKFREAFGERIIRTKRPRISVDQKCQSNVDKDQS